MMRKYTSEKRRSGPEIELPHRLLRNVLREECRRSARPAAGQHERFGVDHEAIHEPQQHGNHEHGPQRRGS